MRRTSVHLHGDWSGEIEAGILEWGAGSDARSRKWRHLLLHRLFEQFFAFHAAADNVFARLKALEDPVALTELGKDVFGAAVHLVVVVKTDKRLDVGVAPRQEDRIFRLVRHVGVEETAADADESG